MLMLRNSASMGSALSHLEFLKRDMITTLNLPIWNSGRSVHRYIYRCASSNPRMSLFTDHTDANGETTSSSSPMRCRRTLSLSDGDFTASTCRNSESAEASSLIGPNIWTLSHPSLDEVSNLEIACLENQVEHSISAQQIQIQLESDSTSASISQPLGPSLISMKGEEFVGDNVQVTSKIMSEFVESLQENYPLVSRKNEDYGYSTLEVGPNGVPLFCTARGCRVAHVSETEHMNRGSGIERRGGNFEAAEDQNSKNSRDMYYQSMLEVNPGNPLLLSNYAKFLHEVQHDIAKAEEYYGRAILASPEDAEVLSLYAKFIWETHNDAARAETYFARAVKAAADDCYVLSSYANFLWNSEEEEDQNDGSADLQNGAAATCIGSASAAA